MIGRNATIFLSGRLAALVVLLAFQVVLVRLLSTPQYAIYALVFGFAALMQTAVSLGIPRVISKYVPQAGWRVPFRTIRSLAWRLLALRVVGSSLLMLVTLLLLRWTGLAGPVDFQILVIGGLFILSSLLQMDADSMAQALMKQRVSRACTVGEATLRLALVGWLASRGQMRLASDVLLVSLLTSSLASAVLLASVFRTLSARDETDDPQPLDWKELKTIALGSYASAMAWFASSPAVIRFIGSRVLPIATFAGFAFSQGLVLSFQRYTPGLLIFPFLEPSVMKHFARTGDRHKLEAALSLIIKIDMIFIGAAVIGTTVAGAAIVGILTGGKYAGEAYALPWLLIYITTSSLYKSFEIVAIALSAASVLLQTLLLSLVWLAAAILLSERFGLIAMLLCPVGDALSRLGLMYHALGRIGVRHVIDVKTAAIVLGMIALFALGGIEASHVFAIGRGPVIVVGVLATLSYLAAVTALRPFRRAEIDLIATQQRSPVRALALGLARR